MNLILCDDNLLHLDYALSIAKTALDGQDAHFHCYNCYEDILALTHSPIFVPHIAILDIELDGNSGISLAKELNLNFPDCQVIFLTSFPSYASNVYQTSHVWFVLKNQIEEYLPQALEKALCALENKDPHLYITVKQKHEFRRLCINKIFSMERLGHQTQIMTADAPILVRQSPDELLQGLPAGCFIRCHQSYWVNASKISAYANNEFHLLDGSVIPVSRTFKKEALAALQSSKTPV